MLLRNGYAILTTISKHGRDGEIGRRSGLKIRRSERTVGVRFPLPAPDSGGEAERVPLDAPRAGRPPDIGQDASATGWWLPYAAHIGCRLHPGLAWLDREGFRELGHVFDDAVEAVAWGGGRIRQCAHAQI